ncbi:anthranilate phosphoribosyltransferase [Fructilactobacillus myrtifloralis]|uniref:Anthranilate phosphoribosyltransferase n=1 Tax=Fructilactobacillus myrtifloralis TaxID=2940301 RepID=A0ABY5BPI1_9LACO|nr:anthranilate phosphoribosyltransferase [Fructilactobacillus myrtifloralis]USS85588.1 anthranilate phosphoribosyltransferase [Fructilactobacillus myrtifloralis]
MIKTAITLLSQRRDLTADQTHAVLDEMMNDATSSSEQAAFLMGLTSKGATVDEISGAAASLREHATQIQPQQDVLEIVGTGGDHAQTFNISTTTALVVAATGMIPVAKHGNRAASSESGAADVLEALGVNLASSPVQATHTMTTVGICFLFAQKYHQAMRFVAPVRRELAIPTLFNYLGPLANPAGAMYQLLGVNDAKLVEPMAQVLDQLGVKEAMVVHGDDGLDEVTLTTTTQFARLHQHQITTGSIDPEALGLSLCSPADLVGGTPQENAEITRNILQGERGPRRDVVLLNAACALHVARPEVTIAEGLKLAAATIDSGKAAHKLAEFVAATNEKEDA